MPLKDRIEGLRASALTQRRASLHVVPEDELDRHESLRSCPCGPTDAWRTNTLRPAPVVLHRSIPPGPLPLLDANIEEGDTPPVRPLPRVWPAGAILAHRGRWLATAEASAATLAGDDDAATAWRTLAERLAELEASRLAVTA